MSSQNLDLLIAPVLALARAAGQEILSVYPSENIAVELKENESPLTLADLRSHQLIEEGLRNLTPGMAMLSEESKQIPYETRSRWNSYWLVDPLDGTKEFLSRNGEFTVNIALIEGHTPVFGVVHVPVTDTTYWGLAGKGAWRLRRNRTEQISVQDRASSPIRVVGSKSHRGDSLDAFLTRLGPHEMLPVGSSLKFCMVAEGAADIYPRLGPTCEWDTAAAQAVVTGAGGCVTELNGLPLEYNTKDELLNPSFAVFADRTRDWLALMH